MVVVIGVAVSPVVTATPAYRLHCTPADHRSHTYYVHLLAGSRNELACRRVVVSCCYCCMVQVMKDGDDARLLTVLDGSRPRRHNVTSGVCNCILDQSPHPYSVAAARAAPVNVNRVKRILALPNYVLKSTITLQKSICACFCMSDEI